MKTNSAFALGSFSKPKKGTKVSSDLRAEIRTTRGFNKFTINGTATALMGLRHGDYIDILVNDAAEDVNSMYVLVKSSKEQGGMKLANPAKDKNVGRPLTFNYSGVYSKMLQATTGVTELSAEGLIAKNLMRVEETQKSRKTNKMCTANLATQIVSYKVSEDTQEVPVEINEEIVTFTAYPLVDIKVKECAVGEKEEVVEATDEL